MMSPCDNTARAERGFLRFASRPAVQPRPAAFNAPLAASVLPARCTPVVTEEVGGEALGDSSCRFVHRVSCQVSIPRGGFHLAVTQQLADHRQTLAECQRSGRERVAKVMNPDIVQAGACPDDLLGVGEITKMGARVPPRNHPRTVRVARKAGKQLHRHGR